MGEHDRSGRRGFGGVERTVQIGEELAGQCVAIVLGVERDRGDSVDHVVVDHSFALTRFGTGHVG
jgi:hypothetical protein